MSNILKRVLLETKKKTENEVVDLYSSKDDNFVFDVTGILSLRQHQLGNISSSYYIQNFISLESEQQLIRVIKGNAIPWVHLHTRKLKCLDGKSTFPPWATQFLDYLINSKIFSKDSEPSPNHILINSYKEGQGILHHTDGPKYYSKVAILSLDSSCLMTFRKRLEPSQIGTEYDGDIFSVFLEPRSLFVFEDSLYTDYMHGISFDRESIIGEVNCINQAVTGVRTGEVITRRDRISLTIRHMYDQ
jgi:alkylated DNA repair protein alkB family protein 6